MVLFDNARFAEIDNSLQLEEGTLLNLIVYDTREKWEQAIKEYQDARVET